MKTYKITNKTTGVELGTYQGNNEQEALNALAQDAGYKTYEEAPGAPSGGLEVVEVSE